MDSTEVQSIRDWFLNFFNYFRSETAKLPPEAEKLGGAYANYSAPCQVELFWLKEPEYQLILKTNFTDRVDKEIIINGPFATQTFLRDVETILRQPRWSKPVQNEDMIQPGLGTYAEVMASRLAGLVGIVQSEMFRPEPPKERPSTREPSGMVMGNDAWLSYVDGNIVEYDYVKMVDDRIQNISGQLEYLRTKKVEPPTTSKMEVNGYGTYFFPPIIFGEIPEPTISDVLHGRPSVFPFGPHDKAFDAVLGSMPVIVSKDGFVAVQTPKKDTAIRALNTIMAVGVMHGFGFLAVREHELSEVTIDPATLAVVVYSMNPETIRSLFPVWNNNRFSLLREQRKVMEESEIKNLVGEASWILEKEPLADDLRLLIEGYTHLKDSEYGQSFIMSWSIIERYISWTWRELVNDKVADKDRLTKLKSHNQWTIDYQLEALNLAGRIDGGSYEIFMELKTKRNGFIHRRKQIMRDDAERCWQLSKTVVEKELERQPA